MNASPDELRTPTTPGRRRRRLRSLLAVLAAIASLGALAVVSAPPATAAPASTEELQFFQLLNQTRAAYGKAPLNWDDALGNGSRSWSNYMASINTLTHDQNLAGFMNTAVPGWTRAGENVGVGYDVGGLHNAFVASPPHFANMIGDYDRVGIGVVKQGDGKIWVTFRFAMAPSAGTGSWPMGNFDSASQPAENTLNVAGWALDPDVTTAVNVHIYVDGGLRTVVYASGGRADVAGAFPAYGNWHGWSATLTGLSVGNHQVCAYGINADGTPGGNSNLGCKTVAVKSLGSPFGNVEVADNQGPNTVVVSGWTLDPNTTAAVDVQVRIDGVLKGSATANLYRPDVGIAFGKGSNHGYRFSISDVPIGNHQVCVRALNVANTQGTDQNIGCQWMTVRGDLFGAFDSIRSPAAGKVRVAGWAIDPDTTNSVNMHVYVDGAFTAQIPANVTRTDVAAAIPGWGANHGFASTLGVPRGHHLVCVFALNAPGTQGNHLLLGCAPVDVG